MKAHAARRVNTQRVFDLLPRQTFVLSNRTVVRLDQLERMVRNGPITGYAPWAPEFEDRNPSVGQHRGGRVGAVRPENPHRTPLGAPGPQQAR